MKIEKACVREIVQALRDTPIQEKQTVTSLILKATVWVS
jgi:hypothetical protein